MKFDRHDPIGFVVEKLNNRFHIRMTDIYRMVVGGVVSIIISNIMYTITVIVIYSMNVLGKACGNKILIHGKHFTKKKMYLLYIRFQFIILKN